MVLIISLGAIFIGLLLIFFLSTSKNIHPEIPEDQFYSSGNDHRLNVILNMERDEFANMMKKLLIGLGFEIDEMIAKESEGIYFSVFDPEPIKGGKFIVQAICSKEIKLIDSSYIINLLDNVKGESALKGIFITPHFFTREAQNAAADTQLSLINGKRLINLLKDFELLESSSS